MNTQLGLKIVKSLNGYQEVAECNGDSTWTKNVRDTRDDLKVINGLQSNSNASVIMYSANNAGEYYTLVSAVEGRLNDFISAWIFRPWNVEIGGKELEYILKGVREEILANEINVAHLKELFSKTYPQYSAVPSPICTEGGAYAVRYYNKKGVDYNLAEILSKGMAQKINTKYKAVFLIDGTYNLEADGCEDVSSSPLNKMILISPPSSQVVAAANGFLPYLEKEQFTKPIMAFEGSTISVTWKKSGFKDRVTDSVVTIQGCMFAAPTDIIFRRVEYSIFDIRDEKNNKLTNCRITVSGKLIPANTPFTMAEASVKDAKISVHCDGFVDYTGTHDLSKNVNIQLQPQSYQYTFVTEDKDGNEFRFVADARKELHCTPLRGYHSYNGYAPSPHGTNRIEYRPGGLSKKIVWILLPIIFCVGLVLGGLCWGMIFEPSEEPETEVKSGNRESDNRGGNRELGQDDSKQKRKKAKDYLDSHDQWDKGEMEVIPELKGLWEKLNSFDRNGIKKFQQDLESDNLEKIVDMYDELYTVTDNKPSFKKTSYSDDDKITIQGDGTTYLSMLQSKIDEAKRTQETSKPSVSNSVGGGSSSQKKGKTGNPVNTVKQPHVNDVENDFGDR